MNKNDENCVSKRPKNCKKNAHQYVDVTLPINLEPIAVIGDINIECCGEPDIIYKNKCDCYNKYTELVITQTIIVTIPIEYEINTFTGKSDIKCKEKVCK